MEYDVFHGKSDTMPNVECLKGNIYLTVLNLFVGIEIAESVDILVPFSIKEF
jgi:hypothetical protein